MEPGYYLVRKQEDSKYEPQAIAGDPLAEQNRVNAHNAAVNGKLTALFKKGIVKQLCDLLVTLHSKRQPKKSKAQIQSVLKSYVYYIAWKGEPPENSAALDDLLNPPLTEEEKPQDFDSLGVQIRVLQGMLETFIRENRLKLTDFSYSARNSKTPGGYTCTRGSDYTGGHIAMQDFGFSTELFSGQRTKLQQEALASIMLDGEPVAVEWVRAIEKTLQAKIQAEGWSGGATFNADLMCASANGEIRSVNVSVGDSKSRLITIDLGASVDSAVEPQADSAATESKQQPLVAGNSQDLLAPAVESSQTGSSITITVQALTQQSHGLSDDKNNPFGEDFPPEEIARLDRLGCAYLWENNKWYVVAPSDKITTKFEAGQESKQSINQQVAHTLQELHLKLDSAKKYVFFRVTQQGVTVWVATELTGRPADFLNMTHALGNPLHKQEQPGSFIKPAVSAAPAVVTTVLGKAASKPSVIKFVHRSSDGVPLTDPEIKEVISRVLTREIVEEYQRQARTHLGNAQFWLKNIILEAIEIESQMLRPPKKPSQDNIRQDHLDLGEFADGLADGHGEHGAEIAAFVCEQAPLILNYILQQRIDAYCQQVKVTSEQHSCSYEPLSRPEKMGGGHELYFVSAKAKQGNPIAQLVQQNMENAAAVHMNTAVFTYFQNGEYQRDIQAILTAEVKQLQNPSQIIASLSKITSQEHLDQCQSYYDDLVSEASQNLVANSYDTFTVQEYSAEFERLLNESPHKDKILLYQAYHFDLSKAGQRKFVKLFEKMKGQGKISSVDFCVHDEETQSGLVYFRGVEESWFTPHYKNKNFLKAGVLSGGALVEKDDWTSVLTEVSQSLQQNDSKDVNLNLAVVQGATVCVQCSPDQRFFAIVFGSEKDEFNGTTEVRVIPVNNGFSDIGVQANESAFLIAVSTHLNLATDKFIADLKASSAPILYSSKGNEVGVSHHKNPPEIASANLAKHVTEYVMTQHRGNIGVGAMAIDPHDRLKVNYMMLAAGQTDDAAALSCHQQVDLAFQHSVEPRAMSGMRKEVSRLESSDIPAYQDRGQKLRKQLQFASVEGIVDEKGKVKSLQEASSEIKRDFTKIMFKQTEITKVFVKDEAVRSRPGVPAPKTHLSEQERAVLRKREKEINTDVGGFKARSKLWILADVALVLLSGVVIGGIAELIYTGWIYYKTDNVRFGVVYNRSNRRELTKPTRTNLVAAVEVDEQKVSGAISPPQQPEEPQPVVAHPGNRHSGPV